MMQKLDWSADQLTEFIGALEREKCKTVEQLCCITKEELRELGVPTMGERSGIIAEIQDYITRHIGWIRVERGC